MRFQGEDCVLNMASYFNRNDVSLNATLWVRSPLGESARYRQPWLRFSHSLPMADNEHLRAWLRAVAAGKPVEPLTLPGPVRQVHKIDTANADEITLVFQYDHAPEPIWWAWDITSPLLIRLDIPSAEFANLITVFDQVEWSFY